eukprot:4677068-Karenia_brevis.AAC.1
MRLASREPFKNLGDARTMWTSRVANTSFPKSLIGSGQSLQLNSTKSAQTKLSFTTLHMKSIPMDMILISNASQIPN